MSNLPKRKYFSIKEKLKIIDQIENGTPRKLIQAQYGLPFSTISSIVLSKDKLLESMKPKSNLLDQPKFKSPYELINFHLIKLLLERIAMGLPLTKQILIDMAMKLVDELKITGFNPTDGWVMDFQFKFKIKLDDIPIEENDLIKDQINKWNEFLPTVISNYKPSDIYCMDEFGLFFNYIPNDTFPLVIKEVQDHKYPHERITCVIGCNMTGTDKLDILLIGKARSPRWLSGVHSLPLEYKANKSAMMDSLIFREWIIDLDNRMSNENRKILLFLTYQNSTYCTLKIDLKNIQIYFFPPNLPTNFQPLSNGIIKNLKYYYKKEMLNRFISNLSKSNNVVSIKDTARVLTRLWEQNIRIDLIEHGFILAGFDKDLTLKEQFNETLSNPHYLLKEFKNDPPLSLDVDPFTLPPPPSWSNLLNYIKTDAFFLDYIRIDDPIRTIEDITPLNPTDLNPIIHPTPQPIIEQPELTELKFKSDDFAIASLFNSLKTKPNVPTNALKALSYIDEIIAQFD